jgi:hypothetical protein
MLSEKRMREGRVLVVTAEEYVRRTKGDERHARAFDFALAGLCRHGSIIFPYPGMDEDVVMLDRTQAEHLVVELLKQLAPDGELPDDQAELLDFITTLPLRD